MKNSLRKRIIALGLCAILTFNSSVVCFANEVPESEPAVEAIAEEVSEPATEAVTEPATEAVVEEPSEPATEAVIEEATEAQTEEETEAETETESKTEESVVESEVESETEGETEESKVEETEEETETESESEEESETEEDLIQVLDYEDEDVKVVVEAASEDAIPEEASLKVTPITESDKEYSEVEKQLNEKAEGEEYEIAGFLAYDITFVDKDENKVEPNGDVRVTIDYKKATLPEAVNTDEYDELDVTVMHFEENANGEVKEIVDMVAATNIEAEVKTTENGEVKKAEFVTDSFSVYTITWTAASNYQAEIVIHYVDEKGNPLGEETDNVTESISGYETEVDLTASKYEKTFDGYSLSKRVINAYNNQTKITKIKVKRSGNNNNRKYHVQYYTDNWKDWEEIKSGQKRELDIYFVYETYKILDVNKNDITTTYAEMLATMKAKVEDATGTNLPIRNWARSSSKTVVANKASNGTDWKWSAVGGALALDITDESRVWDGSRLNDKNQVEHYFNYLEKNMVSAYQGVLYDSATWKLDANTNGTAQMYRFRGSFDIGGANPNEYTYTLKPVTGGNRIYINDDIFVFVYPVGVTLTDDNFMDYLAFWTGTTNQSGNYDFHGRYGTLPTWGNKENLAYLTDGWYLQAISDNAGSIIQSIYNEYAQRGATPPTAYYVDVITDDYASGGGMYRLQLEQQPVTKTEIKLLKLDADTNDPLAGAKFSFDLTDGDNYLGVHYTATSNENGEIVLKLVPGTYIMTEEDAPNNYDKSNDTWQLVVTENGYTLKVKEGNTYKAVSKYENTGLYAITNKRSSRDVEVLKVNEANDPLAGAEFKLYSDLDCTKEKYTATSDADGKVIFKTVEYGTYYLKELSAPSQYEVSTSIWTVVVDEDGYSITLDGQEVTSIVNKSKTTSVQVTKIWNDGNNVYETRPTEIEFRLEYKYTKTDEWKLYEEYALTGDGNVWSQTIDNLPVMDDQGTFEYRVVEITDVSGDGYVASMQDNLTMVNTLVTHIVKRGLNGDGNPVLQGAVFKITNGNLKYYGQSDSNGIVKWYREYDFTQDSINSTDIQNGTYVLEEIVAPTGYMVSDETWNVTFNNGVITMDGQGDDNSSTKTVEIFFDNVPF